MDTDDTGSVNKSGFFVRYRKIKIGSVKIHPTHILYKKRSPDRYRGRLPKLTAYEKIELSCFVSINAN